MFFQTAWLMTEASISAPRTSAKLLPLPSLSARPPPRGAEKVNVKGTDKE